MSVRNILDGTIKTGTEIGPESTLSVKTVNASHEVGAPRVHATSIQCSTITAVDAKVSGTLDVNELYTNQIAVRGGITMAGKPVLREFVESSDLVFTLTMQDNTTKTITQKSTYSLTSVGQCINMFGFYADLNTTGMDMPKKVTVTAPVPTYNNIWKAYNIVAIRTDGEGTLYQATCTSSAYKGKEGIDLELRFTQNVNVPFLVIKLDIPMH